MRLFSLLVSIVLLAACTSTAPRPTADTITVEGQVSMRGNEPFATYMLETDNQNLYVLTFDEDQEQTFTTASRYRLTGTVSADLWNGRRLAHLRVLTVEM
ncbi:MAG: hypothetical protein AAF730_04085, partial [Bacteroidota bacterium]